MAIRPEISGNNNILNISQAFYDSKLIMIGYIIWSKESS